MSENMVDSFNLSNGLKILGIQTKSAPVVALQAWIRFGAADETDEIAGLAHLFEHLLFKGTKRRPVGQIAKEIESIGGDVNAYTSYDQTVMHLTIGSQHIEQGIDILSDSIINSVVDPEELEREKDVILEEIARRNDMPGAAASDLLHQKLYEGHPYSRPVIGYADVVKNMSRDKILELYKKYYNSQNMFLVVCGDYDPKKLSLICEKHFFKLPSGSRTKARPKLNCMKAKGKAFFAPNPHPHPIAHMTWRGPKLADTSVAALDAYSLIVGNGESSRLYKNLVLKNSMVHSIGTGVWSPKDQGCFDLGIRGNDKFSKNFNDVISQARDLMFEPISEEELEVAKKNLISDNTYAKETVDGLAQKYGYFEVIAGDYKEDDVYNSRVESLTVKDVEKARDTWINDDWVVTGITPLKKKAPKLNAAAKAKRKATEANTDLKDYKKDLNYGVETFEHNNLKVILRKLDHIPMFSMRLAGLGGMRIEPNTKPGLGRLWEHCVLSGHRGTDEKLWTRDKINKFVDASSASVGSFHGRNSQGFNLDGLSEDFESLMELLSGIWHEPLFTSEDIKIEKTHQLADLKSSEASPNSVLSRKFREALYGKTHAYGKFPLGNKQSISSITAKDLKNYHQKIKKSSYTMCIVGDISKERVVACLDKYFAEAKFTKQSSALLKKKKPKYPTKEKNLVTKMDKEQTHILRGFPTCDMSSKDKWGLLGLSAVLSGQGGRLFMELRDKMSLCYSVASTHLEALDGGHFAVYIGTTPEKKDKAINAIDKELNKVLREGIPEKEWKHAQKYFAGNHVIDQQRLSTQCISMLLEELYGFGWKSYFDFSKDLQKVTAKDIHSSAKKYLSKTKNRVTTIVEPKKR